jgi:hypothetical protein
MVVVKVSLHGDTVVNELSRVVRPEKVRRHDHQRNTQTNSSFKGESRDDLWAENDKSTKKLATWPVFLL